MVQDTSATFRLLRSLADALGASQWLELEDACVVVPDSLTYVLNAFRDPGTWWEAVNAALVPPEPSECIDCGQQQYRGEACARFTLGDGEELVLDVYFLGHCHLDEEKQVCSVHVVQSAHDARMPAEARQLFESSYSMGSMTSVAVSSPVDATSSEAAKALDRIASMSVSVDSYLAALSHDLRTPLNAILGYSEMLLEDAEASDDADTQPLEQIHESGRLLLDTVAQLERQIIRERHKRKLSETLRTLSTMMAASLDFDDVVERVHDCISQVIDYNRSRILLVGDASWEVVIDRCSGPWSIPEDASEWLDASHELLRRALAGAPESLIIEEVGEEVADTSGVLHPDCRSWMATPLMSGGEPLALISLESKLPNFYDGFDADLMTALAHHAALALTNAQQYARVRRMAEFDPLTGAYTRGHFFQLGERQCLEAVQFRKDLAVMMFDIDHFKPVNDTYGHAAGDKILTEVVSHCRAALRSVDLIGRYGGEEFAVVLPGANMQIARSVAERVRRRIALSSFRVDDQDLSITVSVGIAALEDHPGASLEQLIKRADVALYDAKRAGRNQVMPRDVDKE